MLLYVCVSTTRMNMYVHEASNFVIIWLKLIISNFVATLVSDPPPWAELSLSATVVSLCTGVHCPIIHPLRQ